MRATGQEEMRLGGHRQPCPQLGDLPFGRARAQQQGPRSRKPGEAAVAGEQPALLGSRLSRQHEVMQIGGVGDVESREAQPAREPPQHGVAGELEIAHTLILGSSPRGSDRQGAATDHPSVGGSSRGSALSRKDLKGRRISHKNRPSSGRAKSGATADATVFERPSVC